MTCRCDSVMNQYLDAAIKAARAAGALVRENFGRPLKVNVKEAHDIKLELDVRSQALITDYQGTPRANQYLQGRVKLPRFGGSAEMPEQLSFFIFARLLKKQSGTLHRSGQSKISAQSRWVRLNSSVTPVASMSGSLFLGRPEIFDDHRQNQSGTGRHDQANETIEVGKQRSLLIQNGVKLCLGPVGRLRHA